MLKNNNYDICNKCYNCDADQVIEERFLIKIGKSVKNKVQVRVSNTILCPEQLVSFVDNYWHSYRN